MESGEAGPPRRHTGGVRHKNTSVSVSALKVQVCVLTPGYLRRVGGGRDKITTAGTHKLSQVTGKHKELPAELPPGIQKGWEEHQTV